MMFTRSLIEKKLLEKVAQVSAEAELLVAVIAQAIVDGDVDFLRSRDCKQYSELLGIEISFIKEFGAVCITHNIALEPKIFSNWLCRTLSCSARTAKGLGLTMA